MRKHTLSGEERDRIRRLLAAASRARATPLQRWRRRRDCIIWLAHREGLSLRTLADVFNLSPSRVHAIVAAVERQVEILMGEPS